MTDSEIVALLDSHDSLVTACIEGSLSLLDVVAAYGGFPHSYALDEHSAVGRTLSPSLRQRVAFHAQVAGVLAGVQSLPHGAGDMVGGAGDFMPRVVVMRLRQLMTRHPEFKAV